MSFSLSQQRRLVEDTNLIVPLLEMRKGIQIMFLHWRRPARSITSASTIGSGTRTNNVGAAASASMSGNEQRVNNVAAATSANTSEMRKACTQFGGSSFCEHDRARRLIGVVFITL